MKNCVQNLSKVWNNFCQRLPKYLNPNKIAKDILVFWKWRNFAKAGHTSYDRRRGFVSPFFNSLRTLLTVTVWRPDSTFERLTLAFHLEVSVRISLWKVVADDDSDHLSDVNVHQTLPRPQVSTFVSLTCDYFSPKVIFLEKQICTFKNSDVSAVRSIMTKYNVKLCFNFPLRCHFVKYFFIEYATFYIFIKQKLYIIHAIHMN